MRLTWITDIHLDFVSHSGLKEFARTIAAQKPDLVVATGDLANGQIIETSLCDLAEEIGVKTLFVLGNHDFYGASIAEIREWAQDDFKDIEYMHGKVKELNRSTAIVGVDGMADATFGNAMGSNVLIADWQYIEEMVDAGCLYHPKTRRDFLQKLGKQEAETLREPLAQALAQYDRVFVMTHIPPWVEATWHQGKHSDADWLPWFSCAAVGKVIKNLANQHRDKQITVLCGHTHGYGHSVIESNIEAYTGAAQYYAPEVQLNFDIFEDGSYDKSPPKNLWELDND